MCLATFALNRSVGESSNVSVAVQKKMVLKIHIVLSTLA